MFQTCLRPFLTAYFFIKTSTSRRDGQKRGGDFVENRKCVTTQGACVACVPWQEVDDGCDGSSESNVPFWFHMARMVRNFVTRRLHSCSIHCQQCSSPEVGEYAAGSLWWIDNSCTAKKCLCSCSRLKARCFLRIMFVWGCVWILFLK